MYIDSGWDFITLAQQRWGDSIGTQSRQILLVGDEHWWLCGIEDLTRDRISDPQAWAEEVVDRADQDHVRYAAVVVEVRDATPDYSFDAHPYDRLARECATARELVFMGTYFLDQSSFSATGPAKTFSTYTRAEEYPVVTAERARLYPHDRRTATDDPPSGDSDMHA